MQSNEQVKKDKLNYISFEHDWFGQLTTAPLPKVRSELFLSALETQDALTIDKSMTWILPSIHPEQRTGLAKKLYKVLPVGKESSFAPVLNLVKSSGIYAIASLGPPLVVLGLAPFLTHYLSPSEYGILTILNTFIGLVSGITQLGLGSAFFRAYGYDYTSSNDRRAVLATTTVLLCMVSIPIAIGIIIAAPSLAFLLFNQTSRSNLITITSAIILSQNLTVPGFAWLRAESRAFFYSFLSIGNVLIMLLANIVLVGILHQGVAGSLIGTACGNIGVVFCMMPITLHRAGIKMRIDIARSLLAFGLPLVLNFVSYWVLQLSDRYLLSLFESIEQTARYSVAYTLGSAMSIVIMAPFTLAWPTAMFTIAKRKDATHVFQLVFRWFSMILLFAAFGLSLVGNIVLTLLFPFVYHSAALIIPVIAVSLTFYGVYYIFMVGANVTRRTWLAAVFTTTAAIANLAINLLLIPLFGAMGAAVSTLFAYIILAAAAYIVNQRIYPVRYEIGIFTIALLIGAALYIGSDFLGKSFGTYGDWSISFCTLILYGGCLALLGKLPTKS